MNNNQAIALVNSMAFLTWQVFFWSTPYDTGNLARSIGDVGMKGLDQSRGYSVGFELFDSSQAAPYGKILNEAAQITYRTKNGAVIYPNRHYMWVDKFFERWASELPLYFPVRRTL